MSLLVKDSVGKPSVTLTLTLIPFTLVNIKFLLAGLVLPLLGSQPTMSVVEYATALGLIMAPFLVREGVDKVTNSQVEKAGVEAAARVEVAKGGANDTVAE